MGDSIELPWITSDGIRMGYEYGLLELANFSSMIPMDDLNAAISNATDVDLEMSEIYWKEPDSSGGLNFTHIPNFTCSELIAVTHCLSGANAMNSTFPVTLTSMSDPFSFSQPPDKFAVIDNLAAKRTFGNAGFVAIFFDFRYQ